MIAYTIKRKDGRYYKGFNIFEEHEFVKELPLALILPTPSVLRQIILANGFGDCEIQKLEIVEK